MGDMVMEEVDAIAKRITEEMYFLQVYGSRPDYILSILKDKSGNDGLDQLLVDKYLEMFPALEKWWVEDRPERETST
jgi:hypothetical protein